ncbi:MAG: hypothetical protein ACAF41_03550 [Leptolyngbya sp. BL-A-14]
MGCDFDSAIALPKILIARWQVSLRFSDRAYTMCLPFNSTQW